MRRSCDAGWCRAGRLALALACALLLAGGPPAPGAAAEPGRAVHPNREANRPPDERAGAEQQASAAAAREEAVARDALIQAYEKEFAYLEAEKTALRQRLAETRGDARQRERQASAAVERLQRRLVELRGEADALEERLRDAELRAEAPGEAEEILAETVRRARETLAAGGVAAPALLGEADAADPAVVAARVTEAFAGAAELLARGSRIHEEPGAFFRPDGVQTSGTIVRVGNVAAFGVSDGGVADGAAGALAPAGEGRLRLWGADTAAAARTLAGGGRPDPLPLFLYESLERPIEQKAEKTALQVVESGGVIAWVIVALGALTLLLVLLRVFILWRAGASTGRLLRRIEPEVRAGRTERALALLERSRGAAARVLRTALTHLGRSREHLEDLVAEAILREAPRVERFGATIIVFAAVAPLLGLLGTVTGMISTFDVITEHGTGDPKLLSGGISEALVTTELGLIVAVPALLLGTLLNGRAEAIQGHMERAALHVLNAAALRPRTAGAETAEEGLAREEEQAATAQAARAAEEPSGAPTAARAEAGDAERDASPEAGDDRRARRDTARRPTEALGEA